jgi:hypothetical protein
MSADNDSDDGGELKKKLPIKRVLETNFYRYVPDPG